MIVGGKELNADTLQTFFNFHSALLPFLILTIALYHFWRVRKAGGILLPSDGEKQEMLPVMPHLVFRELVAGLVLIAFVFTIAALFNAPLLEKANPAYSMNPTKAPWYFAGVQELLMHFHPLFSAFIIPLGVLAFLAWILSRGMRKHLQDIGLFRKRENGRQDQQPSLPCCSPLPGSCPAPGCLALRS